MEKCTNIIKSVWSFYLEVGWAGLVEVTEDALDVDLVLFLVIASAVGQGTLRAFLVGSLKVN